MIPWFTIREVKVEIEIVCSSLWRLVTLILTLFVAAVIESSCFAVRAGYAARLTGKNIPRTCHGVSRIWNYLVSTSMIHLAICDSTHKVPCRMFSAREFMRSIII
jgi:hypothetical protein